MFMKYVAVHRFFLGVTLTVFVLQLIGIFGQFLR